MQLFVAARRPHDGPARRPTSRSCATASTPTPRSRRPRRHAWDDIAAAQQRYRDIYIPYVVARRRAPASTAICSATRGSSCARPTSGRSRTPSGCASTPTRALPQLRAAARGGDAGLSRVRAGAAVVLARADARVARPRSPDRQGGARQRSRPDERAQELVERLDARRSDGSAEAVRRRPGGRGGQHGSDDRARARHRRRGAPAAEDLRERGRGAVQRAQQAIAEARFKAYRHEPLSGCDVHAARCRTARSQGWIESGTPVDPFTRLARLYERATGAAPFALPQALARREGRASI